MRGVATSSDVSKASTLATKRVVYFVASHVNPEQVIRLIRACRSGGDMSRVLVHHDQKCSTLDPAAVRAIDGVAMPDLHVPVRWGGYSNCEMILQSMRWLVDNQDFDWVVYLSGQDYPVQPLSVIERFLTETEFDGFVQGRHIEERPWHLGGQRYLYRYRKAPSIPGWRVLHSMIERRSDKTRAAGRLPRYQSIRREDGKYFLGVRPSEPFSNGFQCYKGSAWWTLSKKAITAMLDFVRTHPEVSNHYQKVWFAPNESFIQTIVRNDQSLKLMTLDDKRFIRWSKADAGHPDTLTCDRFEEMINSGKHFARKVDTRVDAKLVDMLDEHIGVTASA